MPENVLHLKGYVFHIFENSEQCKNLRVIMYFSDNLILIHITFWTWYSHSTWGLLEISNAYIVECWDNFMSAVCTSYYYPTFLHHHRAYLCIVHITYRLAIKYGSIMEYKQEVNDCKQKSTNSKCFPLYLWFKGILFDQKDS
jgi:hypothetical protein